MEKSDLEEEIESLSHEDLCEITVSTLRRLLHSDQLLRDLPADVTAEEVNSQIAIVHGRAIAVKVLRGDEAPLDVVVEQSGNTVRDLKTAIRRSFELKQQRSRNRTKVSWKYVWRTYNLQHGSSVMTDDKALLSSYGIVNRSHVSFVKRYRKRNGI